MTASGQVANTAQNEATNVAGTAKDEASNVASTAAGAATDVAGTAKQEAANVLGEGLQQAKNLTGQVKEQASQQLSTGSEKLTGSLRGLSEQLNNGDTSGVVGQVLSEAGTRVQSLADELERKGPQGVLSDLQDYARRNPGTFLIGMAAAGFLTGRLVKGVQAKDTSRALTATPSGTAGGAPLAGIAEPRLGTSAGYVTSPYPEETYRPVDPVLPSSAPLSGPSGSAGPSTDYFDEPLTSSPLPVDTETRDPR